MSSLLIVRNIYAEGLNTITGLAYGFPAITNFLGLAHALERQLKPDFDIKLNGCAIVCHDHQTHIYQPKGWGDYVFAQTRNPLVRNKKTGEFTTAPFVQEGKMNLRVSLLIECEGFIGNFAAFEQQAMQCCSRLRLAGGRIVTIQQLKLVNLPEQTAQIETFVRSQMRRLLPGFVLLDRSDLLAEHWNALKATQPNTELLDAWLDFFALKYQAEVLETPKDKVNWKQVPKPASGWLVPMATGYRAISPLYPAGQVANTRDPTIPFCFTESVYSIGEWRSAHRIKDLHEIIWRYDISDGWYLAKTQADTELEPEEFDF